MAKSAVNQLTVSVRTQTGKGASRRARRDGWIPAVLYGHGADPQHLALPGHAFAAVLRHSGTNALVPRALSGATGAAHAAAPFTHGSMPLPAGGSLVADPEGLVVNVVVAPTE